MFWVTEKDDEKRGRDGKKERVLHTRVPAVLEQELKRVATAWRVPVSNVVRALLEDALDTLDLVGKRAEGELRGVVELLASERERLRQVSTEQLSKIPQFEEDGDASDDMEALSDQASAADVLEGAVGVTPIVLVHDAVCGVSGRKLSAGTDAYLVLFQQAGRQMVTARDAWPRATSPASADLRESEEHAAHMSDSIDEEMGDE